MKGVTLYEGDFSSLTGSILASWFLVNPNGPTAYTFAAVIGRLSRGLRESITLQNLNVIRPLERGWVRQVLLTHATADFRDRGKLPRSKKPDKSIE